VNTASAALALPSLTLILMFANAPTLLVAGLPLKAPVTLLKLAHEGLLAIVKVSVSWLASEAVGWNEYVAPATTVVIGVPEIVGGVLLGGVVGGDGEEGGGLEAGAAMIVMAKGVSEALPPLPSLTEMLMSAVCPTSPAAGVPVNCPELVLNSAQSGLPSIANVSVLPSASLAEGWNVYIWPACTEVAGVPLIVGALFAAGALGVVSAGAVAASAIGESVLPSPQPASALARIRQTATEANRRHVDSACAIIENSPDPAVDNTTGR
jgi:hypothetical protein